MVIRVYWASVTGNRKIEGDQSRLRNLIESLKLESKWIDVTTSRAVMEQMRKECGNLKALPPQIFNDDLYLGNVDDMNQSIEEGRMKEWLKIDDGALKKNDQRNGTEPTSKYDAKVELVKSNQVELSYEAKPSEVTTYGKSVSAAVSNFENANKSPKVSHKTVNLQFGKQNQTNGSNNVGIDEERRRRILGLPPSEAADKACEMNHEANALQEGGVC